MRSVLIAVTGHARAFQARRPGQARAARTPAPARAAQASSSHCCGGEGGERGCVGPGARAAYCRGQTRTRGAPLGVSEARFMEWCQPGPSEALQTVATQVFVTHASRPGASARGPGGRSTGPPPGAPFGWGAVDLWEGALGRGMERIDEARSGEPGAGRAMTRGTGARQRRVGSVAPNPTFFRLPPSRVGSDIQGR